MEDLSISFCLDRKQTFSRRGKFGIFFQRLIEDNALTKIMKFAVQGNFDLITSFINEFAEK